MIGASVTVQDGSVIDVNQISPRYETSVTPGCVADECADPAALSCIVDLHQNLLYPYCYALDIPRRPACFLPPDSRSIYF
jgi:hypothetical protein